jgi:catechol 2,3-dioxygenase
MEVKELGHLVLYVRNLDSSASFYRDVLGWRQIMGGPGDEPQPFRAAAFSAPGGRTHHELLLIEVGDDAAGLPPGRRVGMHANQVNVVGASDHTVTHSLYITDPDGNEIELYVDVPGVDWRSDPSLFAAPIRPLKL